MDDAIGLIRTYHAQQRFMLKMQSRIDRSMEAYIRVYVFGFSPDLGEAERKEISKKTTALIRLCRKGKVPAEYADIAEMVVQSDASRAAWDFLSAQREKAMEKLAKQLPVAKFVAGVKGAGLHGVAQVVGEAGDLMKYANPSKLWKRLGLAPYDGLAMSSWKRDSWRPRTLSSEEWVANPFKAERYAIVAQIAQWLWVAQWISAEKVAIVGAAIEDDPNASDQELAARLVDDKGKKLTNNATVGAIRRHIQQHGRPAEGEGLPNGPYGDLYYRRRLQTKETHPDWTPMHSHKDALRIVLKKYILDLWVQWRRATLRVEPNKSLPDAALSSPREYPVGEYEMPAPPHL